MCVTFGLDCVLLDCVWIVQRRTLADVGWSGALRTSVRCPREEARRIQYPLQALTVSVVTALLQMFLRIFRGL